MDTYEKAYKEALERARKLYKDAVTLQLEQDIKDYEYIFPELKESEDERIRKTIIRFFKDQYSNETEMYDGSVTVGKAIAWLKKQGQKPTLHERYENIAQSEWFKKTHEGMSVSDDEESTWTEEDEERLQSCISSLQGKSLMGGVDTINTKWLKSLKQRIEETMKRREQIIDFAENILKLEKESPEWVKFIQGATWADAHPDLYSVTRKAVERERKHLIDKACKRLENIFHDRSHHSGRGDAGEIVTYDFDSMEEFISQFRKDMEEQQ